MFSWAGLSPSKRPNAETLAKEQAELTAAFERLAKSIDHHRSRNGFGEEQYQRWTQNYAAEFICGRSFVCRSFLGDMRLSEAFWS